MSRRFFAVVGCAIALSGSGVARTQDDQAPIPASFQFQWENDLFLLFGRSTDRFYTNGIRFNWLHKTSDAPPLDAGIRTFLLGEWSDDTGSKYVNAYGTFLAQHMYTPRDIRIMDAQPEDRPWGGWLYAGRSYQGAMLVDRWGVSRPVHRLAELSVGMVGPSSRADDTQRFIHRTFGANTPQGWQHQLHDEPTINLRFKETTKLGGTTSDALVQWGYNAGNVAIYGNVGAAFRVGANLCDFGVSPLGPSAVPLAVMPQSNGQDLARASASSCGPMDWRRSSWSVSAGFEIRAVARNLFLDGNTFRDSPSVSKRYLVADGTLGVTWRQHPVSLAYLMTARTSEFTGQRGETQRFGSIFFSYLFD